MSDGQTIACEDQAADKMHPIDRAIVSSRPKWARGVRTILGECYCEPMRIIITISAATLERSQEQIEEAAAILKLLTSDDDDEELRQDTGG